MNELRINHAQYFFNLSRIGVPMIVFYLMIIYLPEPPNTLISVLGKYVGLPLGTYLFFWFATRYPKARKAYICLLEDEVIVNGISIKLAEIKKAYLTEHVVHPIQFWCPGIIIKKINGEQVNYITYYGIPRKELSRFNVKLNKKMKSRAYKNVH